MITNEDILTLLKLSKDNTIDEKYLDLSSSMFMFINDARNLKDIREVCEFELKFPEDTLRKSVRSYAALYPKVDALVPFMCRYAVAAIEDKGISSYFDNLILVNEFLHVLDKIKGEGMFEFSDPVSIFEELEDPEEFEEIDGIFVKEIGHWDSPDDISGWSF